MLILAVPTIFLASIAQLVSLNMMKNSVVKLLRDPHIWLPWKNKKPWAPDDLWWNKNNWINPNPWKNPKPWHPSHYNKK